MDLIRTIRSRRIRNQWFLAGFVLLLIAAIIAFGVAYKSSGYHVQQHSNLTLVKWLPANDGPMKRALSTVALCLLAIVTSFAALARASSLLVLQRARPVLARVRPVVQHPAFHRSLFFRPPPTR